MNQGDKQKGWEKNANGGRRRSRKPTDHIPHEGRRRKNRAGGKLADGDRIQKLLFSQPPQPLNKITAPILKKTRKSWVRE